MKGIPGTKYISYIASQKIFRVSKRIGKEYRYLGSHKSLICALMIRDWCKHNHWKKYSPKFSYIVKTPCGHYAVYHQDICYGTFKTEEEANNEIELCKKCDWDMEILCNLDERINGKTLYLGRVIYE